MSGSTWLPHGYLLGRLEGLTVCAVLSWLQEVESEGLRHVREGRAARLAAAQKQLDGSSNRDQLLGTPARDTSYSGGYSSSGGSFSRASAGRLSPGRNTLRYNGRDVQGGSVAGSSSSFSGTTRFGGSDREADAGACHGACNGMPALYAFLSNNIITFGCTSGSQGKHGGMQFLPVGTTAAHHAQLMDYPLCRWQWLVWLHGVHPFYRTGRPYVVEAYCVKLSWLRCTACDAAAEPAGTGSPARFSRAGSLGSSPGRAAAALAADNKLNAPAAAAAAGAAGSREERSGSAVSLTAWRRSSTSGAAAGAASVGSVVAADGAAHGSVAGNSSTTSLRQPGQHSPLMRSWGAVASPTEQQGLWSGARSAPVNAESTADTSSTGGQPGLLLRRSAARASKQR